MTFSLSDFSVNFPCDPGIAGVGTLMVTLSTLDSEGSRLNLYFLLEKNCSCECIVIMVCVCVCVVGGPYQQDILKCAVGNKGGS